MIKHERLTSLDAFRGATIAGMMIVNNPGTWSHIYPQLEHAPWSGWTFTDWIFPFFLFIVGVAMTFSFRYRMEAGADKKKLYIQVVRRAVVIFLLGFFLAGFPYFHLATIRIPGVLQRIAVCYLIVSLIVMNSGWKAQAYWIIGLLAGYWLMVKLIPVPGYGAGVMQPTGSLCWYVDSHVLAGHTWGGAPVPGFDPEGIVSTIPAIATTLFGVLTGHWLQSERTKEEKTAWMFVAGNIFLLLGAILDMWLPINKNMWTSSYSIFMAGWALVCLAMMYWLIDVKGYKKWATPFVIYGMNAITVFFLSGLIGRLYTGIIRWQTPDGGTQSLQGWIFQTFFLSIASPINASLLYAIFFMLFLFLIAWIMWKKKWFLKV
jgi:predicted acyltransferase